MTNIIMAATFIEQVARYEEAVAKFYAFCAKLLPEDKEFWETLVTQEIFHAKELRRLKEEVKGQRLKLLPDRFNLKEIELSQEYVEQMTRIIRAKGVTLDKALEIACNIENKTVESKVFRAFDESTPEIIGEMTLLHEQERMHLEIIASRMQDKQKKNPRPWVDRLLAVAGFGKK